jgi:hypothetical protein
MNQLAIAPGDRSISKYDGGEVSKHNDYRAPASGTVIPVVIVIVIDLAAGCPLLRAPPARVRLAHRRLLSAPRIPLVLLCSA